MKHILVCALLLGTAFAQLHEPEITPRPGAVAPPSVSLNCTPASTGTAAASFKFYRAPQACTTGLTFTSVGSAASCSYTDTSVVLGSTYCYVATALSIDGQESGYSNQAQAVLPVSPTVTSVSPGSGALAGGTAVTIVGTGFLSGATVTFGSASATSVVVVSATQITAVTPSGTAGTVVVTVTNTNGLSGSLASGFTYAGAPNPPTGLTVSGIVARNNVPLKWNAPIPQSAYIVDAYYVLRGNTANSLQRVATVVAPQVTYSDRNCHKQCYYAVEAYDLYNGTKFTLSGMSNVLSVRN